MIWKTYESYSNYYIAEAELENNLGLWLRLEKSSDYWFLILPSDLFVTEDLVQIGALIQYGKLDSICL